MTDDEQKKFGEHFATLDTDKQAKLSFKNVRHFLSAYQLGEDDLEKVTHTKCDTPCVHYVTHCVAH